MKIKIYRTVDVEVSVGEGRPLELCEDVQFEISGQEALDAVLADTEVVTDSLDLAVSAMAFRRAINRIAAFIDAVPADVIADLSPEARRVITRWLEGTAKRFSVPAPAQTGVSGAVAP